MIDLLPRVYEKRASVQAARRRSDADIFALFGRPFGLGFVDPAYEAVQQRLTRLFEIDRMFDSAPLA